MDRQLKSMMKELGEAINHSLSDSDQIAEVISRIKAGGYDVFVVLEATIGYNPRDEIDDVSPAESRRPAPMELEMTVQDRKFLKALRIRVDDSR